MPEDDAKGGRGPRRRNRKKKSKIGSSSSGDASGAASGPQTGNGNTNNSNQPTSNSGGRGGRRPRSGGGRGRGGGSGSSESRYKPSASSPLQLPHVKVTLRNIMSDGNTKNTPINEIVSSVRTFLEGTFPSSKVAGDGTVETDAYMLAWQAEKEEFDGAKAMFIEASAASSVANNSNSSTTTSSSRPFSSGWVYEEKPSTLPSNRESLLPTTQTIVSNLMSNETDKKISDTTNINWVVDTAMNQMMQECGKSYLHYVGGKIVLDEESMIDVGLAERVVSEREKLAKAKKKLEDEANAEAAFVNDTENGEVEPPQSAEDKPSDSKPVDIKEVKEVTKGIEQLSTAIESKPTATKKQIQNNIPAIRIRILSVTPIKQSKRRGEIGGKVTLALYPPDPCLLFKEACRDAGKMAGDIQFEKQKAKSETDKVATEEEEEAKNEGLVASEATVEEDIGEKKEGEEGEVSAESKKEEGTTSPPPVVTKVIQPQPPQIPYYPLLSPAERSRAVARSRVLIHRTIEAMKIHAVSSGAPQSNEGKWEVLESSSQKTWKSRPHAMVESLMEGKELSELVVEHDDSTAGDTDVKKGRGKGGFVDRNDRLESTIEKSEDYKAFMESLESGGALPTTKEAASNKDDKKKKKISSYTVPVEKPPEVDEEGRPLSAIVVHMRAKQAVIDKANAEAKAKADKAKAAAKKAKDKARKEKKKAKRKEANKKKRGDKGKSSASSSTPSAPLNLSGPPPGATLLKKGSVPASGFGG